MTTDERKREDEEHPFAVPVIGMADAGADPGRSLREIVEDLRGKLARVVDRPERAESLRRLDADLARLLDVAEAAERYANARAFHGAGHVDAIAAFNEMVRAVRGGEP